MYLFYTHTQPSEFSLPTMSNVNDSTSVASVSVAVAIVTLSSIQHIWDDTVNIVKDKTKEGIPT